MIGAMSVARDPEQLQRRTMRVLVAAQVFGGAGFFLGLAVAVLLARELTETDSLIGIPLAIMVASAALAAGPLGSWMQRSGRRPGLAAGQLCGACGACGVVLAARADSFALLCLALGLFGVGNTSNLLARYAASDLVAPERRGRAISTVLLATAAGAILGPNLAEAAGGLGDWLGVPDEAAPFAFSAVAMATSAGDRAGAAAARPAAGRPGRHRRELRLRARPPGAPSGRAWR